MNLAHKQHFDGCLVFTLRGRSHWSQMEMCSPTKLIPGWSHTWQWVWRCILALVVELQLLLSLSDCCQAAGFVLLLWLLQWENTFSHVQESARIVTSSFTEGEVIAFWKRQDMVLGAPLNCMLLLRVVLLFPEGIRPTSSHQPREQWEQPGPLQPHHFSFREGSTEVRPRQISARQICQDTHLLASEVRRVLWLILWNIVHWKRTILISN